jgi:dienelactone hydrolase
MPTLVPTVHERIARCGAHVYVDGLVPGADVVVSVDGVEHNVTAAGGALHLPVPPLNANTVVKAKQDAGGGFTPWSPEVRVEDALVPPVTAPHLPEQVGVCSQCLLVWGMVPGCEFEILLDGDVAGKGTAGRDGAACVGVDLSKRQGEAFGVVRARMIVCGQLGPESAAPLVPDGALPPPVIVGPLFGCQRVVPTTNLHPGARVRYEMSGTDLGSFCSCWTAANVWVGTDLVTHQQVRAQAYWDTGACKGDGPPGAWEPIVPPDERIKPVIQPALVEGDQVIRVGNQIPGATLLVRIRPGESLPYEEFGPRPASQEPEIALNAQLAPGNVVTVVQTLCAVSVESDPLTVQPKPPVVLPPVVVGPLFACGAVVQISNLHPGAWVRVFADGIPIGARWAGNQPSIGVPVNLAGGTKITATQRVGTVESQPSDPPVPVENPRLAEPRVMAPVTRGETEVRVSAVTPGAHVAIWAGAMLLGEADASEPIARIGISAVTGAVHATARLCGQTARGPAIEPIDDPCGAGLFPAAAETFRKYADVAIPAAADGDAFTTVMEGQLYFPSDDGKMWARGSRNLPLVVIAHGFWSLTGIGSYLGYDYLARHLARWGMVVFSINMDDVNLASPTASAPHQLGRAETILAAIDALRADADLEGRIDFSRIGLVGHSVGGEAVAIAQFLNVTGGRGYGIRGVVSIAPTNHRQEIALPATKYLQLFGSFDFLTVSGTSLNGIRIYDRAERVKSHAWIYGLRHNGFNPVWVANGDHLETDIADIALPIADHSRTARCLINAFFQDALRGLAAYEGFMEGTILPPGVRDLPIFIQHSREPRTVVDNFGDVDPQEGLPAEPLDKAKNSRGQAAGAAGTAVVTWEDIDHPGASHSPHETKGLELSWNPPSLPDAVYTSETGGLAIDAQDVVAIRIGQFHEDAMLNPEDMLMDLFVTLDDGGNQATIRAGSVAAIPYPDTRKESTKRCPMRTVRIPVDAFMVANPALNLANILRVKLQLTGRPTGHILADDIEIGR